MVENSSEIVEQLFLQSLAMAGTALLIPRLKITSPTGPLLMVIALSICNAYLWDVTLFYAIPDSPSLQTFVLLLANGAIFWLLVKFVPGIESEGFLPAVAGPVIYSVLSALAIKYGVEVNWLEVIANFIDWIAEVRESLMQSK